MVPHRAHTSHNPSPCPPLHLSSILQPVHSPSEVQAALNPHSLLIYSCLHAQLSSIHFPPPFTLLPPHPSPPPHPPSSSPSPPPHPFPPRPSPLSSPLPIPPHPFLTPSPLPLPLRPPLLHTPPFSHPILESVVIQSPFCFQPATLFGVLVCFEQT